VFSNASVSLRYLADGSPDDARAGLTHTVHLWDRWATLTECVKTGTAVADRELESRGEEWTTAFIAAMHRSASERAPMLVKAIGAEGIHRMLDIGGGSGAHSIAFAQANPELRAEGFDLPAVMPIARGHIEKAGLADRIATRTGDLRRDSFGKGYDLVLISQICHMLSPDENRDLLRRSMEALSPQGRVAVHDFILEPDKAAPKWAALFALNMLVGTAAGSSYSVDEYTGWLEEAGFRGIARLRLPGPSGLIVATRL
jgi:predicted O-methyltransferase YrrM